LVSNLTFDLFYTNSDMYMGGVLVLGTLDHLQIQPSKNQHPFLTSNSINYKIRIFLKI